MKRIAIIGAAALLVSSAASFAGQAKAAAPAPAGPAPTAQAPTATVPGTVTPPTDYVIGAGDVLAIVYWRDKDMTGDYAVRPDGKVTLPLLNDVDAAGLTTEQLRERLTQASLKWQVDPTITVGVKTINSRKVYIEGGINKPGPYDLLGPMSVAQLIAQAGSLRDFVDSKKILIIRTEGGKQITFRYNHKEVLSGKKLEQNIQLKPGDTVLVPND